MDPAAVVEPEAVPKAPANNVFRAFVPGQMLLLPPSLDEWLPEGHPARTGTHPKQALVDAGYCSEANLQAAAERKTEYGTDTFMATGRLAHDEQVPAPPRGRIPDDATLRERMARKLRTKPGRAAYARRKAIAEPVFGRIMTCQDGRELLLRGEHGAAAYGGCSRPATTSARSSDTPEPPD